MKLKKVTLSPLNWILQKKIIFLDTFTCMKIKVSQSKCDSTEKCYSFKHHSSPHSAKPFKCKSLIISSDSHNRRKRARPPRCTFSDWAWNRSPAEAASLPVNCCGCHSCAEACSCGPGCNSHVAGWRRRRGRPNAAARVLWAANTSPWARGPSVPCRCDGCCDASGASGGCSRGGRASASYPRRCFRGYVAGSKRAAVAPFPRSRRPQNQSSCLRRRNNHAKRSWRLAGPVIRVWRGN